MVGRRTVVVGLGLALARWFLPPTEGSAGDRRPEATLAGEWAPPGELAALATGTEHTFEAPFPVSAVMPHWARGAGADTALVEVGVSVDGQTWSDWHQARVDDASHGPTPPARCYTSALMAATPGRFVRLRGLDAQGQAAQSLPDLRVAYVNTLDGPTTASVDAAAKKKPTPTPRTGVPPGDGVPAPVPGANLRIISRADWGADESLRYKDGKEIWPREYQPAEKIILHHTETSNDQDPLAAIRAVYHFHCVIRRWGDIGYNYLIDAAGRIYEGRAGGDHVVGGHALRFNKGSLGIAVLGSYQSRELTPAAEEAIVTLIAAKARFVDPVGQGYFVEKTLANIAGHRDCTSTTCPGDSFQTRLPAIRDKVLQRIGYRPVLDARLAELRIGPADLRTGDRLEVHATVVNAGTAILPGDLKGPGLTYTEGQDYDQRGLPKITGRFRVGVEAMGAGAARYPYRWGLGRSLLPGEATTVVGHIQITQPQERLFTGALVQEFIRYWEQGVNPTLIRVTGPPVVVTPVVPEPPAPPRPGPLPTERQPPPTGPEPNRTYFPETGHYLGYGFRHYWEKNGGLAQFGFPLTEEFVERNPDDGKEYTVQYFERARFEYHPEHKGTPYEVLLGLLGLQVTARRGFATAPPGSPPPREGARYFPETRQWLSGPFLKYWTERGGLMVYGYPISPEFEEVNADDRKLYLVQYFERNRFEYHPEHKGTPHEVMLGLLGRQVLIDRGWLTR